MLQNKNINDPGLRELLPSGLIIRTRMMGLYINIMKTKKCTKCGGPKALSEFYKSKSNRGGLSHCCKSCHYDKSNDRYHTKEGLLTKIFISQKSTSKKRGDPTPKYTKKEFIKSALLSTEFNRLYSQWELSGYENKLAPSFDRDNDHKGYSFENFNKWMKWEDNRKKGHDDRKNGINNKNSKAVIAVHKETGKVIEFYSINEAERQTGVDKASISRVCLKRKPRYVSKNKEQPICRQAGEYYWKFKNN